ncbi:MAG TPA: efflux RND transporter periplasmic adaptor subunit [Byssovorax sp.]|jgi:RND family efflux transporter MFP subunit
MNDSHHGPAPAEQGAPAEDTHARAAPGAELGFALPEPAHATRGRVVLVTLGVAAVLATAFVVGIVPRITARHELEAGVKAAETPTPRVQIVTPKVASTSRSISLPGSALPLEETIVYPRASGYVRAWNVDIGDHVAEGDVLADIETPELDQQLAQARAQLAQADAGLTQAKANAVFSKKNLERYEQLVPAGIASTQDLEKQKAQADVDAAAITVALANVAAMRANIQRLIELKSFAKVVAPFAGTITLRNIDRGALVTEGTTTPLFKVSATDPVRVIIQVPQDLAKDVQIGATAKVHVKEFAGHPFEGKVARTSGALDATTRTLTTEVRVANPKNEILTGMYATVDIDLDTPRTIYDIPSTALITDARGVRVATITKEGRVHFVPVHVERDTGAAIEIASGLDGTERIVKLPSAELTEGAPAEVIP